MWGLLQNMENSYKCTVCKENTYKNSHTYIYIYALYKRHFDSRIYLNTFEIHDDILTPLKLKICVFACECVCADRKVHTIVYKTSKNNMHLVLKRI